MASTTVYLKLRANWRRRYDNTEQLVGFDVVGVTKNRPSHTPVMKVTINIPDQAFLPWQPAVTIDVPEQALDIVPTVTVEPAEEEDGDDA